MKYSWKKAGVQAFLAWSGCVLAHVVTSAEGMPPSSLIFWKHVFFISAVSTGISELTYLREWAQKFLSGDTPQ